MNIDEFSNNEDSHESQKDKILKTVDQYIYKSVK